ncbi:calcium/sodium antiporter [Nonlabens ponticola]|uniref:Calcium/sodium antiporter n=1 Tax=Nonlabens ponticola TaxID=2496866 RepID=A0A3S9MXU7_9FLAO|nr:calcium/sodium antiporter [Nonlabens ponticola]AZQ43964.1 calcium/sodium antiporter [Nonlabens ponticola]
MSILLLIVGLILLVIGGDLLVKASVGLSLKLSLSRMIIGLTVVSFATSAPELIVSVQGALDGYSGLALGNVLGSNIANIGIVLGATALIAPLDIENDFFKFNWPWLLAFTIILMLFLWLGSDLVRWESSLLLVLLVIFLVTLIRKARKDKSTMNIEITDDIQPNPWWKIIVYLVLGGIALWLGSEWLVEGAVDIATSLNIPESVIAVSMIAIGTSIPELAASIIAALKKEKAISLGNLVGSNIFNIGSVLGITGIIQPIVIEENSSNLLSNDMFWMLGFVLVFIPLAFLPIKNSIGRFKGVFLLLAYCIFLLFAFGTPIF